jgi:large subunit ribosomal protein LX
MGEVKIFRITGKIDKPNWKTDFRKEVRALKPEDAVEKIYKELGSKHRAKRFQIRVLKVEEIPIEEVTSLTIKKLATGE